MTGQHLTPGPVPLYYQLKQILRAAIEHGEYRPGDRLPSEPELTRRYGISRITARQALDELEAEGLVIRRHGKGTFVAEPQLAPEMRHLRDFIEDMREAGINPALKLLAFVHEPADPATMKTLHLAQGEEVIRIDQQLLGNGQILAYDTSFIPTKYWNLLAQVDLTHATPCHVLETQTHPPIEQDSLVISATIATEKQAKTLNVEPDSVLLVTRHIAFTTRDEPVYIQERYCSPNYLQYRIQIRQRASQEKGQQKPFGEFLPIFQ